MEKNVIADPPRDHARRLFVSVRDRLERAPASLDAGDFGLGLLMASAGLGLPLGYVYAAVPVGGEDRLPGVGQHEGEVAG